MSESTQRMKILEYCSEHGSITVREAFEELGINSPTKRISEMRKSGLYSVDTLEERRTYEGGVTKRWTRYFIAPVEDRNDAKKN